MDKAAWNKMAARVNATMKKQQEQQQQEEELQQLQKQQQQQLLKENRDLTSARTTASMRDHRALHQKLVYPHSRSTIRMLNFYFLFFIFYFLFFIFYFLFFYFLFSIFILLLF